MHPSQYSKTHLPDAPRRAALFVDYDNLYALLNERLNARAYADDLIVEMLEELRHYLSEERSTHLTIASAYADFSALSGNSHFIQRALYLHAVEPRFVSATPQANAVELQLCVDAVAALHERSDVDLFVLLTGDRVYLPLLQAVQRAGRDLLVAALETPPATERHPYIHEDALLEAVQLLSQPSRSKVLGEETSRRAPRAQRDTTDLVYEDVTDPAALRTLEIIEEYFGQYEEVYLTPLLRKLSELLEEDMYDPKSLINTLELANAVWLEKRRGFPYDYTVLIVDTEHPDVQHVQETFHEREQEESAYQEAYDDDDDAYGDAYYDDDEDYDDDEGYDDDEHAASASDVPDDAERV